MFQAHRPSSKKSLFPSMGHPKIKEKSGLRPRLPKNIANIKQKAPKGSQRGAPGGPRVAQGLQNGSQILSKFLKKRGLCPGALQKGAKGTPGPPKNIKNEGKLTRTRAQHSQKNRDGEEVFAETRGINRASPSPKIGDGDALRRCFPSLELDILRHGGGQAPCALGYAAPVLALLAGVTDLGAD